MTTLAEYASSRELFINLTLRELRSKYKRSALGWAWSLVNPIATMAIFTLVFRFFLKIQAPPGYHGLNVFALYLLCGLLPWNYLQNSVNGSIATLIGNANLIKKTYFPRELIVAANVGSALVSHLIEMGLLVVALSLFGNYKLLLYLPITLLLIALLTLFATGLALAFSVLNVYFRDVQHLVNIAFMIWFYLNPIVYPIDRVPAHKTLAGVSVPVRMLYRLNPTVGFVQAFRDCLYNLRFPTLANIAYPAAMSLVVFALGLTIFNRLEGKLAEEL
jgi:ABC-2 type transport system permease protein